MYMLYSMYDYDNLVLVKEKKYMYSFHSVTSTWRCEWIVYNVTCEKKYYRPCILSERVQHSSKFKVKNPQLIFSGADSNLKSKKLKTPDGYAGTKEL